MKTGMMKTFYAVGPHDVRVWVDDGVSYPLPHHIRHSPTGFSMGYSGSGPAELARCILLECGYPADEVDRRYQAFKREFVATWKPEWLEEGPVALITQPIVATWWEKKA